MRDKSSPSGLRGRFMDLFDSMPFLLVAISPEDSNKIEEAVREGRAEAPNVTVLHICSYPEAPTSVDIQALYAELWDNEEFDLVEIDVVLIEPGEEMRKTLIETMRYRGVADEGGSEDVPVEVHRVH